MALHAPWEKRFISGYQTTSIDTAVTFDASVKSIVTGKPLLKVTNDPTITPGFETVEQNKATGLPVPLLSAGGGEIQIGVGRPTVPIEMDANANNLAMLLWLLFQKGASEGGVTPFVKTYAKYANAEAEVWASVAEVLSTSVAAENRILNGGIVSSLTVASDSGSQSVKVTADIMGGGTTGFAATYDASAAVLTDPAIAVLLFKNMTCEIDDLAVNLDSFTFTITNNLATKPYNTQFTKKHILNRLDITGEIVLPKDSGQASLDDNAMLTKFINLTDFKLELFWGNSPATTDGDVAFQFNCVATDNEEIDSDGEIANRIPFRNVRDDSGNDVSISLADAIDRAIP